MVPPALAVRTICNYHTQSGLEMKTPATVGDLRGVKREGDRFR